jgi:hypothetical protein
MRTKRLAAIVVCAVSAVGLLSLARGEDAEAKKPGKESIVIPADGVKEFSVIGRSTLFRITVTTIAGGEISEPKIKGPAKLIRFAEIQEVGPDDSLIVGSLRQEFVFRGTGDGKVGIVFEIKTPTQPEPTTEKYMVTIK